MQWHVSVGDKVAEDDPIVDVMTDKATVTIPHLLRVVSSLSGGVGDMVAVGSTLLEIDAGGSGAESESEGLPNLKNQNLKVIDNGTRANTRTRANTSPRV